MFVQPLLDSNSELPQFSLAAGKHGDVVHIADIVLRLETALSYHVVKRLERRVGEPLRGICSDFYAIFDNAPDDVQHPGVFDERPHAVHDDLRLQGGVKVVDVALQAVFRTFWVVLHPSRNRFASVVGAATLDTSTGVFIHSAHERLLDSLDDRMVDVLVRPLLRLVGITPFLCAGVIAPLRSEWRLVETLLHNSPQFFHAVWLRGLDPCSAFIRRVVVMPVVGPVNFVYRCAQVLIRDYEGPEIVKAYHRECLPPFSCTVFPTPPPGGVLDRSLIADLLHGERDYLCYGIWQSGVSDACFVRKLLAELSKRKREPWLSFALETSL